MLGLEALEARLPLAGDVTVSFNNGTTTITGDAANNSIAVAMFRGRMVVVPYQTEGNGPTTLWHRGEVVPFVAFNPGQALAIDIRGGNDIASLQWNVFTRRTRFAGGTGRDTVRFNRADHPVNFFAGFEVFEQLVVRVGG
jgi:hypothetical protein